MRSGIAEISVNDIVERAESWSRSIDNVVYVIKNQEGELDLVLDIFLPKDLENYQIVSGYFGGEYCIL